MARPIQRGPQRGLDAPGQLYLGDNLDVLRRYIKDDSVDLVYLDPPFNSNRNYNVLFAQKDGKLPAAQVKAFGDTWRWDKGSAAVFQDVITQGGDVSRVLRAFREFLGVGGSTGTDMLAYLTMMAPRLVELRRVMKPTASIYLHCDPTSSHYLKTLMDAVFGPQNFRNEIIWVRHEGHNDAKRFGSVHDVLLYYQMSNKKTFHPDALDALLDYLERS